MAFEAGSAIVRIQGDISDFKSKIEDAKKSGESLGDALRPVGAALTAIGAAGAVGIGIVVNEAISAQSEQFRLAQILKTATDATDEQIASLQAQAEALQQVGVISAGNISIAQSQLATFDLQAETIQMLTPAILDYVVAEKGAAATTDDLKSMTNGLAQALQGNFASLTKTGFVLDDATKALIENGTEAERAAALVEVLGSTYEGFNAAARETSEGSLQALKNDFNDLLETIGTAFLPILQQVIETVQPLIVQLQAWVAENPKLAGQIAMVVAVVTVLAGVLGPILVIIPSLVTGIQMVGAALMFLAANPIGLVIVAVAAIIAIIVLLIKNWDQVKVVVASVGDVIVNVWNSVVSFLEGVLTFIVDMFMMYIDMWISIITFGLSLILGLFGTNFGEVRDGLIVFWNTLKDLFQKGVDFVVAVWTFWWNAMVAVYGPIVTGVINTVTNLWAGFKNLFTSGGQAIAEAWSGVWEGIKNTAQTVGNAVIGVVKGIINAIIDKINGFIRAVNKVAQAGSVGGLKVPTIPEIPMLAKGGIVTGPTLAMIGEAGPEAVVPLNQSNTPEIGGGMIVNVYDPIVRDESDFGRLGELIRAATGRDLETSRLGVTR